MTFAAARAKVRARLHQRTMISKICTHCGKRIQTGRACSCYKSSKINPLSSYSKEIKAFYLTDEWDSARNMCISSCFGLDIISLFIENKIEYGFTVHHIVPLIKDYSKRLSQSNLIYVTESHHRRLHRLYDAEYYETVEALKTLSEYAREVFESSGGKPKCFDLLKVDRCGNFLFEKL